MAATSSSPQPLHQPNGTSSEGLFPLFAARFFRPQAGGSAGGAAESFGGDSSAHASSLGAVDPGAEAGPRTSLKTLDLKALPRDDGPISETQQRRAKYMFFEKQCSLIVPGLYLAGDAVARSQEILDQNNITHVLNCVGFVCKEYFKDRLTYRTYYLLGEVNRAMRAAPMHAAPPAVDLKRPGHEKCASMRWAVRDLLLHAGAAAIEALPALAAMRACNTLHATVPCRHSWGGHSLGAVRCSGVHR